MTAEIIEDKTVDPSGQDNGIVRNFNLSADEQRQYEDCLSTILKRPPTAEGIGRALDLIDSGRLYRGQFGNMETFLILGANLRDHGLEILADWRRRTKGSAVSTNQVVQAATDRELERKAPLHEIVDFSVESMEPLPRRLFGCRRHRH